MVLITGRILKLVAKVNRASLEFSKKSHPPLMNETTPEIKMKKINFLKYGCNYGLALKISGNNFSGEFLGTISTLF